MVSRILEAEHQYVIYAINLDTQRSTIEWRETSEVEGTMKETLGIQGMMERTLEMIEGTMKGTLEPIETMKNKETL